MTSGFISERDLEKKIDSNKIASNSTAQVGSLFDQLKKNKELEEIKDVEECKYISIQSKI
jgi:hypothetical protein